MAHASWNPAHGRLATADSAGLVIVWAPSGNGDGRWIEEMANNRGGAGVRALRWRGDGEEVVIACGDGHVLVGSVGGERPRETQRGTSVMVA